MVDQQLKHNDCGISAIKTVYNIFEKDISRDYIKEKVALNDKGSRIIDLKKFLDNNGFDASFKLLDINSFKDNKAYFDNLFPFIIPIERKEGLHYVVANDIKKDKIKILDPASIKEYYLTYEEIKKIAHFSKNYIDFVDYEEKLNFLINQKLSRFEINVEKALQNNDLAGLFNKLNYFSYLLENYGFKDEQAEKDFLEDLIFQQEILLLPKNFRRLKLKDDKIRVEAPLILSVKQNEDQIANSDYKKENKENVFFRMIKKLGENRKLWNIYIITAIVSALVTQLAVFINQILIDTVLPSFQINILILFILGVGLFKFFDLVLKQYKRFVGIHFGNLLDKYFLKIFDDKLSDFSIQYVQTYRKGDLMERLSDSLKLKAFFTRFFTKILVDSIVSVYSLIFLFFISWKLSLIVCGVMVIYYSWFVYITPRLKDFERQKFLKKADLFSKMNEKIDGLQVIKNFKLEGVISNAILNSTNNLINIQTKLRYVNLLNTTVVSLVSTVASLLIIVFLAKDAIENSAVTIGQIITFIMLSGKIFGSLSNILNENLTLQEHSVILKRYFDFQDLSVPKTKQSDLGIKDFTIEKFELNNLSFSYLSDDPIIKNLSIEINKNDKIQIEGKNGSGKSTFSKLISMLYAPNKGAYIVNDADSSFYDEKALKEKVLLVTNEDILFNETFVFNVSLGKKASSQKILWLTKAIGLYDFIIEKGEKLEFVISEGGRNLSTGQRKKILLMRALLSDAEIIILDEVLSGIDKESRHQIEKVISQFEKTFIVISHEPVSEIKFNKIFRIQNGRLHKME